jgi:hypothetical protein
MDAEVMGLGLAILIAGGSNGSGDARRQLAGASAGKDRHKEK